MNDQIYDYPLGSISKIFTASILAKMDNEGKIDLDETIDKYLPLKKGNYPTLRELATHTSGYKKITPFFKVVKSLLFKGYLSQNPYEHITKDEVLNDIKPRKKSVYPYKYSDFNYAVIGLVIERMINVTYEDTLKKYCLDKNLVKTKVQAKKHFNIDGYFRNRNTGHWLWNEKSGFIPAGGVYSNINDMLTFCKLQMISSCEIQKTHELNIRMNYGRKKVPMGVGLGWHMCLKGNYLWHRGGVGAFRCAVAINKKRKIAVVILSNCIGSKTANSNLLCTKIYNKIKRM